jgi:hypothetical protein
MGTDNGAITKYRSAIKRMAKLKSLFWGGVVCTGLFVGIWNLTVFLLQRHLSGLLLWIVVFLIVLLWAVVPWWLSNQR